MTTVAVVTGAGRGMGRTCAAAVASQVDRVLLVDRDPTLVEAAAVDVGPSAVAFPADVTDTGRLTELAAAVGDLGTLRVVVHAAGVSPAMAAWRDIVTVDLVGSARLLRACTPLVVPGTAAVCFASMAAHLVALGGDPAIDAVLDDPLAEDLLERLADAAGPAIEDPGLAYGWAKRGVQRLARAQALVWGPLGGRVCTLSPGIIATPMGNQEMAEQPTMAGLLAMSPAARMGRPQEVAAVAAFLVSEAAGFVTGTDVLVDGGCVAAVEAAVRSS